MDCEELYTVLNSQKKKKKKEELYTALADNYFSVLIGLLKLVYYFLMGVT